MGVVATPPRILTADRGDAGRRLDLMLRRHLTKDEAASRTRVQAWIEGGRVAVNGTVVRRVSSRAAFGDVVSITLPPAVARREMAAEDVALRVLFEDGHLIAVDKPSGIVVHPTYRNTHGTLMNALLWRARAWPASQRPSIVGRLDKLTSGIVLAAKSAASHAALQRATAASDCEKDYLAVVHGRVNIARGAIDLRLGRDRGDRRRMVASETTGADSVTRFERLARGTSLSLLRCRLETGRTHQIRVHLAARGWPIVGDRVYGTPEAANAFPRQALHAWRLAFTHPITGDRLHIEAEMPRDLRRLLTTITAELADTQDPSLRVQRFLR
jgi:23S rRNA pseudouridine1911/1915/1917 synthase